MHVHMDIYSIKYDRRCGYARLAWLECAAWHRPRGSRPIYMYMLKRTKFIYMQSTCCLHVVYMFTLLVEQQIVYRCEE